MPYKVAEVPPVSPHFSVILTRHTGNPSPETGSSGLSGEPSKSAGHRTKCYDKAACISADIYTEPEGLLSSGCGITKSAGAQGARSLCYMRRAAHLRLILSACLFTSLCAEHLPVRIYTTADGLAGNTIDSIVRDSHGYLWFCAREGLSRFDGYKFQNFGVAEGLPLGAGDLIETATHDYWIATNDGLARFRPKDRNPHFEIFRAADPNGRFVQALAVDPAGGIWVGTLGGLYRLDPPQPPESSDWRLWLINIGAPTENRIDASVEALVVDRAG